jgi:hypothetical protein
VTTLKGVSWQISIAAGSGGTIYLGDGTTVRKMTAAGVLTTIAGSQANPLYARALVAGPSGDLYVAGDTQVMHISEDGTVTPIAGSTRGHVDGPAAAAEFMGWQASSSMEPATSTSRMGATMNHSRSLKRSSERSRQPA